MSRFWKILLAISTLLPVVYILGLLFVFNDFKYDTIQRTHYAMMVVYFVLLVIYARDVRNNDRVPDSKRALWASLLFLGSSFAHLIYFWLYIWPDDEP